MKAICIKSYNESVCDCRSKIIFKGRAYWGYLEMGELDGYDYRNPGEECLLNAIETTRYAKKRKEM